MQAACPGLSIYWRSGKGREATCKDKLEVRLLARRWAILYAGIVAEQGGTASGADQSGTRDRSEDKINLNLSFQ